MDAFGAKKEIMMNSLFPELSIILIILAISIGLFFLLREVMCWYFKINQLIDLQNDIIINLREISRSSFSIEKTLNDMREYIKYKDNKSIDNRTSNIQIDNNKNPDTVINIEDEKRTKNILEEIGYSLTISNGKWTMESKDHSGLTYYAYTKEELYEKIKNLVNNFKNKEN
jgi:hypothetical protein